MAERDFFHFRDDFEGARVFTAGALDSKGIWHWTDTSVAGTPVVAVVDGAAEAGELSIAFDTQNEAQNVCLSQADKLWLPSGRLNRVAFRVKSNQATFDSATSVAFGLAGDRNDAIDSIAQHALFRCIGSNSIVIETDDGTTDIDDEPTGRTLTNAYHDFVISFARGMGDVKFSIDGQPAAPKKVFDMSAYTGALQLFIQLQKTADANADGITIDWVEVEGRRGITRPT